MLPVPTCLHSIHRSNNARPCRQVAWPVTKLAAAPSLRLLPETSAAAVDLLTMSVKAEESAPATTGSGCGAVPEPVQLWRLATTSPASSPRTVCARAFPAAMTHGA